MLPELQLIYDTAPIGLAFLTLDCRYVQINQRLTEICGISGRRSYRALGSGNRPASGGSGRTIVDAIVRTGKPVTGVEVRGQRRDKRNADHVWITNWHPLKGADGTIVGVNVVAEDITERKRAEAVLRASETALRESEARFHELADNISQFAWTADQSGWIYWYNKRWHDYRRDHARRDARLGLAEGPPSRPCRSCRPAHPQSFDTGTPWEDTFPLRGRDGTYRWFLSRALPIRNEAGDIVRWFGTNTDITEQIEAEKALRAAQRDAGAAGRGRDTRTPPDMECLSRICWSLPISRGNVSASIRPGPRYLAGRNSELIGKSSQWLLHPGDREKTRAEIGHLAAGRKTPRFENRFRHKDGSYHWISWKAVADRGRIYAMGRDVTELKDAENALREARRELAQAARRTTVGHDDGVNRA